MPARDQSHRPYRRVYLLSLWREGEQAAWRAALRPADGGPRLGFADLEQLAAYFLRLTEADDDERAPPEISGSSASREGGERSDGQSA